MLSSSSLPRFRSPNPPGKNQHHLDHSKPSNSVSVPCTTSDSSSTSPMTEKAKVRGSPQLNRWSRARAIRSGRKLDWQGRNGAVSPGPPVDKWEGNSPTSDSSSESSAEEEAGAKGIYIVSDSTGWTAEHTVNAALGQFEPCLVDRFCPVNTHLFSGVEDVNSLLEIVKQAAKEGAMLVYTLADPSMGEAARSACKIWGVPSIDVLGPVTAAIASHLGVSPLGLSRSAPGRKPLSEEYFKRIEAIEFTIKQDDGALPRNLKNADIVLAGVSRTGKTPLSIYLAQKGYKVANVPIVMGVDLPSTLFAVSRRKVFGLTINPLVLQTIRKTRAKSLGFGDEMMCNYANMEHVREELEYASKIFAQNPNWPVIEVTGKAIEETAAVLLRLYHDRKRNCAIPRISKRY